MIGAWPVTWKVSSNRKARVWRTKKTRPVPPPHLLRAYCPAGRVWLQRQRQALAWRTKTRSARPCRTCCTFTVQRRVWRERNRQALAWRTKKSGDARSRLLRVNRPAGRARGLSRRAPEACDAVALRRAAHAIRTRPGLFGTFFPRHAACMRTANPAVCAMRRSESRLATPRRRASCRASRACCTEQRNA